MGAECPDPPLDPLPLLALGDSEGFPPSDLLSPPRCCSRPALSGTESLEAPFVLGDGEGEAGAGRPGVGEGESVDSGKYTG